MASPQWWPVDNVSISGGWGDSPEWYWENVGQLGHNGIDLTGPWGTPLYAIDDGVVVQAGNGIPWSGAAGGRAIMVRSSWGHWGLAHCSELFVSVGEIVSRGQRVASMGDTGLVLGTHVHLDTLPIVPHFANGYSGRVNPASIINLQPRGTISTPDGQEEEEEMSDKKYAFVHNEGGVGSDQTVIIGQPSSGWKFVYGTKVFPSGQRNPENEKWAKVFETGDFISVGNDRSMLDAWERSLDGVGRVR